MKLKEANMNKTAGLGLKVYSYKVFMNQVEAFRVAGEKVSERSSLVLLTFFT